MGRPPGRKNAPKQQTNGATVTPLRPASSEKAAAAAAPKPPEKKSNQPTPAERAEWLAELTRLETAKQRISGETSALATRVKEKGGVKAWKSLKVVHGYKKLDQAEAVALLEDLVVAAAQQDIRISWMGSQATFADIMEQPEAQPPAKNTTGSRDLAAAKAEMDGYNSGKHGAVPSDNPFRHAPGSAEYVSWHNGRDSGEADRQGKKPAETKRLKDSIAADSTLPDETAPTAEEPIF